MGTTLLFFLFSCNLVEEKTNLQEQNKIGYPFECKILSNLMEACGHTYMMDEGSTPIQFTIVNTGINGEMAVYDAGHGNVWVYNDDGTKRTSLTYEHEGARYPLWCPTCVWDTPHQREYPEPLSRTTEKR